MQDLKLRPMTIEVYLAFTDTRPKDEKWELIEGEPVLSPSPVDFHQKIAGNIYFALTVAQLQSGATWEPLLGVGTRVPVSPNSLPEPDVMVKEHPLTGSRISDEALVLFEVLSPSNRKADREWRQRAYASIPNCQHYVTVNQSRPLVVRYDRAADWRAFEIKGLKNELELPALGVTIALATMYRATAVSIKAL